MVDDQCDISKVNASSRTVMTKGQSERGSSHFGENAGFDISLNDNCGSSHFGTLGGGDSDGQPQEY
jgi:hypothetical protein